MDESDTRIGLALSGGGFRAMLFHLGVVRFLRDIGKLEHVSHISAVSGGSILGAHLVLNWKQYNKSEAAFDEAAQELVDFVRMDIRGRIVRRWLPLLVPRSLLLMMPPWLFSLPVVKWLRLIPVSPTELLEWYYGRLYKGQTLSALQAAGALPGSPDLHILATSLTTGNLCSFSKSGFWMGQGGAEGDVEVDCDAWPIARAVAASSGYPVFFPPIELPAEPSGDDKKTLLHPQSLTDGGVYDNVGIVRLRTLAAEPNRFDIMLVSDAQAKFNLMLGKRFRNPVIRAMRASDLLMKRVSDLEDESSRGGEGWDGESVRVVVCKLETVVDSVNCASAQVVDPGRSLTAQKALRGIRTDLDEFPIFMIDQLVRHGYGVARKTWIETRPQDVGESVRRTQEWSPFSSEGILSESLKKEARKSEKHEFRMEGRKPRVASLRDWVTWVEAIVVIALICVAIVIGSSVRRSHIERETRYAVIEADRIWNAALEADRKGWHDSAGLVDEFERFYQFGIGTRERPGDGKVIKKYCRPYVLGRLDEMFRDEVAAVKRPQRERSKLRNALDSDSARRFREFVTKILLSAFQDLDGPNRERLFQLARRIFSSEDKAAIWNLEHLEKGAKPGSNDEREIQSALEYIRSQSRLSVEE